MGQQRKLLSGCVAILMVVFGVSGCGNESQAVEVPDTVFEAVDDLLFTPAEVSQAEDVLNAQCLQSHGLEAPIDFTVTETATPVADVGGVFRSKSEAVKTGYSSTQREDNNDPWSLFEKSLSGKDKKEYEKLTDFTGKNDDKSCLAEADRVLFGSPEAAYKIVYTYNDYKANDSSSTLYDADVQKALTDKYFPCMKKAGYDIRKIGQMSSIVSEQLGQYRLWGEKPSAKEQEMATIDYECQTQADLLNVFQTALKRTAGKWMVENEAMLLERHEKLEDALKKSNQVLKGEYTYKDYLATKK
ncbi:MAG: hypothetical protein LKJ44_03265 [Bifidobacteriaceae bacterium]|jgi:hypothetical protein|nr:hypothetical protein [Bifidobacteriaceae bacterium]MCI1978719.1 hypothetical protein [Bifidobacteriaceae bacterium]